MNQLPTLDAHGHLSSEHSSEELTSSGTVLAMTLSLDEAENVVDRQVPNITWGVGVYPRKPKAQDKFNID
jgi:hypothetical protein